MAGKQLIPSIRNALLFPRFVRQSTGGVEEGEGHGPRKEVWELTAGDMTSSWDLDGTRQEGSNSSKK